MYAARTITSHPCCAVLVIYVYLYPSPSWRSFPTLMLLLHALLNQLSKMKLLISSSLPSSSYRRLLAAGIPCPEPIIVTQNVLVMTFIGEGGWPSPRLRDANLVCFILLIIHDV